MISRAPVAFVHGLRLFDRIQIIVRGEIDVYTVYEFGVDHRRRLREGETEREPSQGTSWGNGQGPANENRDRETRMMTHPYTRKIIIHASI